VVSNSELQYTHQSYPSQSNPLTSQYYPFLIHQSYPKPIQKIPSTSHFPTQTSLLTQTSHKQPLIMPTRLPFNPLHKPLMKMMLISTFNLLQMIPVPMNPHNSICEKGVFGTCAVHCIFEEEGVAHGFVDAGAELVEERVFHVA
jgi:hypothetical protein